MRQILEGRGPVTQRGSKKIKQVLNESFTCIFKKQLYLFTYLALLVLHCYVGIFLVAERGLLFIEVHGLLIVVVSLVEHAF